MAITVEQARQSIQEAERMIAECDAQLKAFNQGIPQDTTAAQAEKAELEAERAKWRDAREDGFYALARAESGVPGIIGSHGDFQWLNTIDYTLNDFARLCPGAFVDRFLAVTSLDSGPPRLTPHDEAEGWRTGGKLYDWSPDDTRQDRGSGAALGPRLRSLDHLPEALQAGLDASFHEWYVFRHPSPTIDFAVFVNWMGFSLWNSTFRWLIDYFWQEVERVNPESYVSEGWTLVFVTRNAALFESVLAALSADLERKEQTPSSGPATE
ncbi:MAG: hypothetical protein NTZ56_02965 [Acidobacteria bacterium]|nr:hypothetical protein [Acidobacteriota bacterium]